jgi:Domain of unknown function (DUF4397)
MRRMSILAGVAMTLALTAPALAQDTSPAPSMGGGSAWVRVLHASPDAPTVDVYLDGAKVGDPFASLTFGSITPYVEVPAGTHAVKVCAAADASVCPIDVPALAIAPGTRSTIAATNVLASIEAQVLADTAEPVADKAQVRVVHFAADAPAVDVLTQDGGTAVVTDLSYPNATGYLALDPGSYDLKICANANHTVCPIDPPSLELAAGQVASVFAIGSLTGGTITAIVADDAAPGAMASDAPASPAV